MHETVNDGRVIVEFAFLLLWWLWFDMQNKSEWGQWEIKLDVVKYFLEEYFCLIILKHKFSITRVWDSASQWTLCWSNKQLKYISQTEISAGLIIFTCHSGRKLLLNCLQLNMIFILLSDWFSSFIPSQRLSIQYQLMPSLPLPQELLVFLYFSHCWWNIEF